MMYTVKRNIEGDMVPTGFRDLDLTGSMLRRGCLSIIAGRPSMGKTGFALNLIARLLEQGFKVCYISTELFSHGVIERLCRMFDWPDLSKLTVIDDLNILADGLDWVDVVKGRSPNADVVIMDRLYDQVAGLVAERIREFPDTAFIATMMVSRKVEEHSDKHPSIADITAINNIRDYVYCAATIYRDDYYGADRQTYGLEHVLQLNVHLWDRRPGMVFLSVNKDFILSDFRGEAGTVDFTDSSEGVFRFIDSLDYRKFLGSAGYKFTALEKTWLAWRCRSLPLPVRIAAIRECASSEPDLVIRERPGIPTDVSLGEFVKAYADDAEGLTPLPKEKEWIRKVFENLWFDFPVPFAGGALVRMTDNKDSSIYLYPGDIQQSVPEWEWLKKNGGNDDMKVEVWSYDPELGFIRSRVMPLDLRSYDGEISTDNPVLGLVSDYMGGRINLIHMLDGIHDVQHNEKMDF